MSWVLLGVAPQTVQKHWNSDFSSIFHFYLCLRPDFPNSSLLCLISHFIFVYTNHQCAEIFFRMIRKILYFAASKEGGLLSLVLHDCAYLLVPYISMSSVSSAPQVFFKVNGDSEPHDADCHRNEHLSTSAVLAKHPPNLLLEYLFSSKYQHDPGVLKLKLLWEL